jgi:hypothetical protein
VVVSLWLIRVARGVPPYSSPLQELVSFVRESLTGKVQTKKNPAEAGFD